MENEIIVPSGKEQMVNKFMKSITNRAFMAKKQMYNTPKTEQSELLPMYNLLGASGDMGISDTPANSEEPAW